MSEKKKKFSIYEILNLRNFIYFLVSIVCGIGIFVIFCLIKNVSFSLLNSCDGFFVGACVLIGVGILQLVVNQGTLDVIAVGFSNLFSVFKKDGTKKYDGIYGYQEAKQAKRKQNKYNRIPIVFAGVLLLIVALILRAIYQNSLI